MRQWIVPQGNDKLENMRLVEVPVEVEVLVESEHFFFPL